MKQGADVLEAISEYQEDPNVEYAESNYIYHINSTIPNDPDFDQQWGLDNTGQSNGTPDADIDAPEAWDIETGNPSVVIAVVDTGVDWDHPDLANNVWINSGEIEGNGIDDDGNGYIDDYRGWDFVTVSASSVYSGEDPGPEDNDPMDFDGHGTHVSGIIGAVTNNSIGVSGVAWDCKLMAVRAGYKGTNGNGYLQITDIANAITYATDNGANIINMSFSGSDYSTTMKNAIDYASAAGLLLVAAAGNDYGNNNDINPVYPASYDNQNIIAVAATDHNDNLPSFSNYGPTSVDVAAPGVNTYSSLPGNLYGYKSGTSMAAPHVAGLAALVWSEYWLDSIDYLEVKNRILFTVDQLADLIGKVVTEGRINAYGALTIPGPFIYSLNPDHGPEGLSVTILGGSFGDTQGASYVDFNGVTAPIISWSRSQIECSVPYGATTGEVTVTTAEGTSNGELFTACSYNTYYRDADGDGYGNPDDTIQDCFAPEGYVDDNTDCNDTDPSAHPGALEICNGNDNDCNALVDDNCVTCTIIFVPDNFSTIRGAIEAASDGCEIIVRDGTYVENINFKGKAIIVRSENGAATTIIDGNASDSVVTFNSGESADSVLDGFTITNGTGTLEGSRPFGGGIYCKYSSPTITNCIISGNMAGDHGGGIFCSYSSPTITNCTISSNSTEARGTYVYGGGGIYCHNSSITIINCTISGNTATGSGGGIDCFFSSPTITNCTISGNTAGNNGGGIRCYNSSPYIVNTIFWSNGSEIYKLFSNPKLSYCDIQGGYPGLGNIDVDPLFVDPGNGDYHLGAGSPCIDAGHPRIYDSDTSRSDMGVYGGGGGQTPIQSTLR